MNESQLTLMSTQLAVALLAAAPCGIRAGRELVDLTGWSRNRVTTVGRILNTHGLATIDVDPEDRRARRYRLTERGHNLAAQQRDRAREPLVSTGAIHRARPVLTVDLPPHGISPTKAECERILLRPATIEITRKLGAASAATTTSPAMAARSGLSPGRVAAELSAMVCQGLATRLSWTEDERERRDATTSYRLTLAGYALVARGTEPHDTAVESAPPTPVYGIGSTARRIVQAWRDTPQTFVSLSTLCDDSRYSYHAIAAALRVLVHRGLAAERERAPRGARLWCRLTSAGYMMLTDPALDDIQTLHRRPGRWPGSAPTVESVVAAIHTDVIASPPLWPSQLPPVEDLAIRYRAPASVVTAATGVLVQRGLLVPTARVGPGRSPAYRIRGSILRTS